MTQGYFGRALPAPFRLRALDIVDSTNDEAKRAQQGGEGHGLVVWARRQTAGRGRRGRAWVSAEGNLHCSFLLDPGQDWTKAPELAFVAAVAVQATLAGLAPTSAFQVKWPNDILCRRQKICGMLLEQAAGLIVVGIGINVTESPAEALYPTTFLREQGSGAEAFDILAELAGEMADLYDIWRTQGFAPVRERWLAHAAGIGEPINVRLSDERVLPGRFAGLDEGGGLLLADESGRTQRILAGDVFFPTAG